MLKFTALSIAALAASTAYAQTPEAAPTADPSAGAPATEQSAQPGAAIDPGAGAPTAQAAPSANHAQVVAVVDAGFPKYDADKDGKLSEAEFKQWIADLKAQEMASSGKPADPATVSQYANAAFAAADRNKTGSVTKQDMITFLGG
jgi:Ca2+-binding EF-hand superfamily protein